MAPSQASPWSEYYPSFDLEHPPDQECDEWEASFLQNLGLFQPSHSCWPSHHCQCLVVRRSPTLSIWYSVFKIWHLFNISNYIETKDREHSTTSKLYLRTPSTHSSINVKDRVWSPSPHISNLSVEVIDFLQKAAGAFSLPPKLNNHSNMMASDFTG